MNNIGKPCAGELHARFDEGEQVKLTMVRLVRHRQAKAAANGYAKPTAQLNLFSTLPNAADDVLIGGLGEDTLVGGGGNDLMDGDDTHIAVNFTWTDLGPQPGSSPWDFGVFPTLTEDGAALIAGQGVFSDQLFGGSGNDHIDPGGTSKNQDIWGFGIYGGAGNDTLVNGGHMYERKPSSAPLCVPVATRIGRQICWN